MLWACCTATLHSSRTVPCAFTKKCMQVFIVTVTVVKAEAQRYPWRVVLMDGDVRDRRPLVVCPLSGTVKAAFIKFLIKTSVEVPHSPELLEKLFWLNSTWWMDTNTEQVCSQVTWGWGTVMIARETVRKGRFWRCLLLWNFRMLFTRQTVAQKEQQEWERTSYPLNMSEFVDVDNNNSSHIVRWLQGYYNRPLFIAHILCPGTATRVYISSYTAGQRLLNASFVLMLKLMIYFFPPFFWLIF